MLFSINHPVLAAFIAAVLLAIGLTIIVLLWTRVRAAWRRRKARRAMRGGPVRAP